MTREAMAGSPVVVAGPAGASHPKEVGNLEVAGVEDQTASLTSPP